MLSIRKKFLVFSVNENRYACKYGSLDLLGLNAYLHVRGEQPDSSLLLKSESMTVENDLTKTEEEILSGFTKQTRNFVRQAEAQGVKCYFHQDIKGFVEFFNAFASSKGIDATSVERLKEMGEYLHLSYAELDGHILAAHSYMADPVTKVTLCHQSASRRLLDESIDRNLIGKANKYLHYQDMLYFKRMGYEVYDFGGFAKEDDPRELSGVNNFKLLFGGSVVECNNYVTIPYAILKFFAKRMGFLGSR